MSAGPRSILRGWVWLLGLLLLSSSTAGGLPSRPASARTFIGLGSSRGATFAITRRVLLAHGAAALLLPATAPAATMTNGVQIFDVASAALDRRAYRGLVLANGMRVLLASDPAAGKAAAAMNVQVGSMSNPHQWQGLAHFCEHMLFLGTSSYPVEGEFENYISANGGSNNAFTDSEETVYFFDVGGSALPGALSRFADFFVSPLFTEAATAREVAAIDSEHSKNLQSDGWREQQLLRATRGVPGHPYNGFFTGNRASLKNGGGGARAALLDFYREYYRADQMALALIGPQGLDELQALAVTELSRLPTRPGPPASAKYDPLGPPLKPDGGGNGTPLAPYATVVVPVRESRSVSATWCFPVLDFEDWLACKPQYVLSQLLAGRAEGSLLWLLKKEGLATTIEVGVEEETHAFAIVTASFSLTDAGLADWSAVLSRLFSYLRLLRERGVPSHAFSDATALVALGFQYAEPSQPQQWATSAAGGMPLYPPAEWITGPALITGDSGPAALNYLLSRMTPRQAMVELYAKGLAPQAPLTEPIYGTRYGRLPIAAEVAAWETAPLLPELRPPPPNRFIPRKLAIKLLTSLPRRAGVPSPSPTLLTSIPAARVHVLPDRTFARPRAYAYFMWRSPEFYTSPGAAVAAELYGALLAEVLQEETFEAAQAGLVAQTGLSYEAFTIQLGGYDERLPDLARLVASRARTFEVTQPAFDRKLDVLRRQLRDAAQRQPVALASYHRNLAMQSTRYSNEQLSEAAAQVTLSDVAAAQAGLLKAAQLEVLVTGNLREAEAATMVRQVADVLPTAPLPPELVPQRRVRVLPLAGATQQWVAENPDEANSALELYLQVGSDKNDDWLYLLLLSQMLDKAVYSELRTKQQLGYIVQCGVTEAQGVRALLFIIQSSVKPPPELEARLEAFLRLFRGTLSLLSDDELGTYRDALAAELGDVDQRADGQASRLWGECALRRYDFGRPWRNAQRMRAVTREGLIAFFDDHIAAAAPMRRRLSTHVFAKRAAPKTLRVDPLPNEYWPPLEDRLAKSSATNRAVVAVVL